MNLAEGNEVRHLLGCIWQSTEDSRSSTSSLPCAS